MAERLKSTTFALPVEKIRAGYKSDVYFNRTRDILRADGHNPDVTMQVFQKVEGAVLCGMDQALAILEAGTGYYKDQAKAEALFRQFLTLEKQAMLMSGRMRDVSWTDFATVSRRMFDTTKALDGMWVNTFADLNVTALYDGDRIADRESAMHIEGNLADFANLETLYLGALTDGTCVATNTRKVVEAAGTKPVLMFGARHNSHESQAGDGYAAIIGGARGVSTHEQGEYVGKEGSGTIPHALIAAYGGDTTLATLKFDQHIDPGVNRVALTDFSNDCVGTSLEVARALGGNLWGVRLDTSENMIDKSVWEEIQRGERGADKDTRGVNPRLVFMVRDALDREGYSDVKIAVSGGFSADKIKRFEALGVPVDLYGVGSSLFEGSSGKYDFTADVVKPVSKIGRQFVPNPRLIKVNPQDLK